MTVGGGAGSPSFSSPIVWTVTKQGAFNLKITEGEKAKKGNRRLLPANEEPE